MARELKQLDKLKDGINAGTIGTLKVVFRRQPTEDNTPVNFEEGSLLTLFKAIHTLSPGSRISGNKSSIAVWTSNMESATSLLNIKQLSGIQVKASCPAIASFKARIQGVSVAFTEAEILEELRELGVTQVRRLYAIRSDGRKPLDRVILTFDRQPPTSIFLGYKSHALVLEPDQPMVCFKCLRPGHIASQCSLQKICRRCGTEGHIAASCQNSPRCVNCHGPHPAGASSCPRLFP